MRKATITRAERLQLIGLMTLAHQASQAIDEADDAMVEIIGESENGHDRAGHLSDEYFQDYPNVDRCLRYMKIKVK